MNFRTSFALNAGLLLGVVVGSVGLSACGGGGPSTPSGGSAPEIVITPPGGSAPEIVITPPGGSAPEIVITPPGGSSPEVVITPPEGSGPEVVITPPVNRAPIAVSIPVQTLTTGPNAGIVDVATYFMDPDNDQLTYSAVSDNQDIVMVGISGSMMILTPVSAGTTTVTVTASDGDADVTQTIDTMVQEPEIELTDVMFIVGRYPRRTYLSVSPVPADAKLRDYGFYWVPFEAGRIYYSSSYGGTFSFWFDCSDGYNDDVTITLTVGSTIEKSVSVTCHLQ